MPEKKPNASVTKPAVAERPVSDVFEGRQPSAQERNWAEKTLQPTLEKAPEKPIGAATGTNLDEHDHARFSTISNVPIRRLYTPADLPADWNHEQYLGFPGQPPYTRGIHATGYRGKLWTMRMVSGFASPEYIAQKEYIYPPAPSMRLVIDTFEFGSKFTPRFNTISISGYHIREAGSTALQELAFTIYDGVEYVEWARRRGLDVDDFGPRLSFFFNAHNDFFEEIAKYRAARKIWYRLMKDRFGAKNDRTRLMRFHTQTAGVSLPAQQPMNNIARVALQALAAALRGPPSLHSHNVHPAHG